MINLNESMGTGWDIELVTPGSAVRCASVADMLLTVLRGPVVYCIKTDNNTRDSTLNKNFGR